MSDFPDPDEEFELMYGDEFELLREQNTEDVNIPLLSSNRVRKSLNFDTPSKSNSSESHTTTFTSQTTITIEEPHHSNVNPLNNTKQLFDSTSNSKKRLADDFLLDSFDIENYDFLKNLNNSKKHKADNDDDNKHQKDLDLMNFIIQRRNEFKNSQLISLPINSINVSLRNSERDKRNVSLSVPRYPFVKIKSFNGQSVYVRFHSEEFEKDEIKRIVNVNSFQGLMGDSFKTIWDEANELISKQFNTVQANTENDHEILTTVQQNNELWVNLYKPKKYLELLSDENTNRTMLRWIKLWDKVVFNRNPKIKIRPNEQNAKKPYNFHNLNSTLDEHGRPHHKVALLCGPPGLGKTTLAHMVAKHAGYNIVEINASDDRSLEAFRTTLENSTQMRSVVDESKRPNCIIFDEIDGAPAASIDFLVKFISGTAPIKGIKSKNKGNKSHILKRPIICICNDAYVPALRPLRQIAFIINFPRTSSARLAERLMEIAKRQQIKTDIGAMIALAEKSNHDIRSCLSVLHFYKAQNKQIGLTDIYKANVGQKDMQKGLFMIWSDIFEIKRTQKGSSGNKVLPTMKDRMEKILQTIGLFGDHERVAQGVYENFPRLQLKDKNLNSTSLGIDWFCYNDVITKCINTDQNYSLTGYLNYAFVIWHFVFASVQKPKISYPSIGYEYRMKDIRHKAIIAEQLRGMAVNVRCYQSALPLILDVIPLLLRIISPSFRPVSQHLYTEEERTNLQRVAGIMADYNLNYIQERNTDGTYDFKLEPNVEELVLFKKSENNKNRILYFNRQLIAKEIELEKMRRIEAQNTRKVDLVSKTKNEEKQKHSEVIESAAASSKALPNHLQTLQFKILKSTTKVSKPTLRKDFFGRVIENVQSVSDDSSRNLLKNDVFFRYKEGYSNAVKKRIKIKELK
ncbi:hypothetical protein ABEB36_008789 [Hypothenemus hampei]|uniref:AAA+ ATPase domain-containing protein n=1 Tax=Hypothenemus hampei TaxID=57062 RepID=A0ABD1ENQ9_HYPHA